MQTKKNAAVAVSRGVNPAADFKTAVVNLGLSGLPAPQQLALLLEAAVRLDPTGQNIAKHLASLGNSGNGIHLAVELGEKVKQMAANVSAISFRAPFARGETEHTHVLGVPEKTGDWIIVSGKRGGESQEFITANTKRGKNPEVLLGSVLESQQHLLNELYSLYTYNGHQLKVYLDPNKTEITILGLALNIRAVNGNACLLLETSLENARAIASLMKTDSGNLAVLLDKLHPSLSQYFIPRVDITVDVAESQIRLPETAVLV